MGAAPDRTGVTLMAAMHARVAKQLLDLAARASPLSHALKTLEMAGSVRTISPRDQPDNRPKSRTVPDGFPVLCRRGWVHAWSNARRAEQSVQADVTGGLSCIRSDRLS